MLADYCMCCNVFPVSSLPQNGMVTKDLTRLKMLLSEIEVSVCEVVLTCVSDY